MSRASSLHRLQEIDLSLDRAHAGLGEIQAALEERSVLQRLQQKLETAEEQLKAARTANKSAEHAVGSQRAKIEITDKKLYGGTIQNPKELQDLQNESESLKRYLLTLEDRLLESMVALEEVEKLHEASTQTLTNAEEDRATLEEELGEQRTKLIRETERLQTEREGAVASVSEDDLALYEKLRQAKGGVVVSRLEDECCSACGMNIPPAKRQTVGSMSDLVLCTQCGRILYAG
ncbi:MAG TPA: hypothetical protein G4O08_06100 [Anaerolineae bacterium]|nr:hypothetical protein [Anaerolineae bacterium]